VQFAVTGWRGVSLHALEAYTPVLYWGKKQDTNTDKYTGWPNFHPSEGWAVVPWKKRTRKKLKLRLFVCMSGRRCVSDPYLSNMLWSRLVFKVRSVVAETVNLVYIDQHIERFVFLKKLGHLTKL
jgi:hypothetical protein